MLLGKDKQVISLAAFLLFSASAGGQAEKSFKYQTDGTLPVVDVISGSQTIIINYSIPEVNVKSLDNINGKFYRISIPGHISSGIPGKPELPVYSRLISIPEGADFNIKITDIVSTRIKPARKNIDGILFPVQESDTKQEQQQKRPFQIDRKVYDSKEVVSSDTVKIELLGIVRNKKIANLYISPVRYNPRSNVLEVITSMKIVIRFSEKPEAVTKSIISESTIFNESLSKGLINYNPGEVVPGFSDQPVKMVIITDTAFRKQLKPFLTWKMQKGFKVRVLYKGIKFAGNTYTELKDTLTKIYNSSSESDPPPEYLLIIGDVNRIPYYGAGGTGNVTDMYYGEFDGNGDYIPEMFVGRLPVADTSELKSVLSKIIQYEKFQYPDSNKFYSRALATAGYDAGYADYMNGQVKYLTSNYLTKTNNIDEYHFLYPQSNTSKDSILRIINKGISFINYTGHGDATGWLHVDIKVADTSRLHNANMYPFVISNACRTAQFNTRYAWGNRMVVSGKKGAIGFIGCSNDSFWDDDYYWAIGPGAVPGNPTYTGSGLGAFDRLFHTHKESPSDWYYTMGQINYAGNLAVSATTSARKKYYWETYNLIGDPSVIPVIGKPSAFSISLPDTLPNGLKSLSLNIDPFAYVAISHFDILWDASYGSASGSVVLDMPGLSNDSCLIVITGQNKLPIIKTVHFGKIKTEYLNLTSSGINDVQGNNNTRADFGEQVYLKLNISNLGMTDASNLYAKISSDSKWLTIKSDSAYIGTLSSGSEVALTDKLGIAIADSVPDLGVAVINLTLKDLSEEKHYKIDIAIHAPSLEIVNFLMDDSEYGNHDHIADPGETINLIFKVRNNGSSDISGQFNITSQSNINLTILQPEVKSGVLKFGETTEIPVLAKLSDMVPSGSSISISSNLNCNPFFINKDFLFRVGKIRESFEAASFNVFPWMNSSVLPWTISSSNQYEGTLSAQSGKISHSSATSLVLRTVYTSHDSLKFYYKVSSEANYDYLSFKLNGSELLKKSGDIPWSKKSVYVPAGLNKMEWVYKKDQSVSNGSDCAWLDMIDFAVSGSVTYIQKDIQVVGIVTPVQKDEYGQETVTVRVVNVGKDIIKGFNLAYNVNDRFPSVKQFFEDQLTPNGDTVTVAFRTKADLSKYGKYKLVAYSFDNKEDYLNNDTVAISLENVRINESVSIFPNPFRDRFTLAINSQSAERLVITITNVNGVKLYETEKDIFTGNNTIVISYADLLPAVYYINIKGSTINKIIPVIKIE